MENSNGLPTGAVPNNLPFPQLSSINDFQSRSPLAQSDPVRPDIDGAAVPLSPSAARDERHREEGNRRPEYLQSPSVNTAGAIQDDSQGVTTASAPEAPQDGVDTVAGCSPEPANENNAGNERQPAVQSLWKVWALEMACLFLSAVLFITVFIVLLQFDERPLSDWPLKINLNSFLSLFTTLTKAAILVSVSAAISHIQWTWFHVERGGRSLYDLHVIDQASRGAWGSLVLLWRFRFRHFITCGAFLVAVSTITSPITQLAINYPVRNITVQGPEAAFTQAIRDLDSPRDNTVAVARRAVYMATYLDSSQFNFPIPYASAAPGGVTCLTGNCTFGRYQSLGICMKMANISSHLRVEEFESIDSAPDVSRIPEPIPGQKLWIASLSDSVYLAHQSAMSMFTDVLEGNATYAFGDDPAQQTKIISFFVIYTAPTMKKNNNTEQRRLHILRDVRDFHHEAIEVLFHLCVQTYETNITLGVESTEVTESPAEIGPSRADGRPFVELTCSSFYTLVWRCEPQITRWNDTISLRIPSISSSGSVREGQDKNIFTANHRSMEDIAFMARTAMLGSATISNHTDAKAYNLMRASPNEFIQVLTGSVLYSFTSLYNPELRQVRLYNLYRNIATTLSATLRTSQPGVNFFTAGVFNVSGEAKREVPHVSIGWGWTLFLAAEIAAAILFLALTIVGQRGRRPSGLETSSMFRDSKNSSLCTLVALGESSRAAIGTGLRPMSGLEETSKALRVRLEEGKIVLVEEASREDKGENSSNN